MIRRQKTDLE